MKCDFICSLSNLSNKVRWSLDFRWQKAGQPVGYYGLKEGVRMRSSTDPDLRIDWEPFDAVDRHDPNAKVYWLLCACVYCLRCASILLMGRQEGRPTCTN